MVPFMRLLAFSQICSGWRCLPQLRPFFFSTRAPALACRLKYNQQLLKQTLAEVEEIKLMLRTIFAGLKDSFNFERSLIERVLVKMKLTVGF